MKTRIHRDAATARRPGRPIPAAVGTAGWAQAEADRALIRTVLRAPPDWRARATTPAPVTHLPGPIQRKLEVGAVNDPLEHEADRIADQVMRMPAPEVAATSTRPQVSRKCVACEEDEKLQRKSAFASSFEAEADIETKVSQSKGRGRPLPDAVRAYMEPRFGVDFSHVRVHTGSDAIQMNRNVGARAFTHGSDIYFGAGHSPTNLDLSAHELTHVVQQSRGPALGIQRAPPDYTQKQTNVAGSGMTRLEVHGLKFGTWQEFAPETIPVTDKEGKVIDTYTSYEREKTKESASHMAVVFVPDDLAKLDKVDKLDKPVQVLLHFHGWGFRKGDPYAGYRIGKDKGGTVRDVDQEHLEQQVGAFVKDKGPLVVGILAQGVGMADFGDIPTFEYIRDVLLKSKVPALVKIANDENYSVVLSAHSGGGSNQVVPMMKRGEAETAERSSLAPQKAGKDGRVVNKLQPVNLIVLFEALHGSGDVNAVVNWVKKQIDRLVPVLKAAASPPDAKAQAELAATPKLRGYFGNRTSDYATRYKGLNDKICKEIADRVPAAWQADVGDLFRIIAVDDPDTKRHRQVEHEEVISGIGPDPASGTLSDALAASRNPASDRAKALPCSAPAPPTPTKQAPKGK